jgi:Helicase conserved C-terminal domain/Restriction endonuclease
MLRQLRRKFASSISIIQNEEDFLYKTWLRVPLQKTFSIGVIVSRLVETSHITYEIEQPFYSKHFFELNTSTVLPEDLKYLFGKVKTNPIFFQLLFVPSKIVYHPVNESNSKAGSSKKVDFILSKPAYQDVAIRFKKSTPEGYSFKIISPEIKDYLDNLKPKVMKLDLLNLNDFPDQFEKEKIKGIKVGGFGRLSAKKVVVQAVQKPPKMYKVKVPGMGNYKSKVSRVNLEHLEFAKVSKSATLNFTQPTINSAEFNLSLPLPLKDAKSHPADISYDPGTMINELTDNGKANAVLKLLQKNTYKVDWEKRQGIKINLTKFENDGARFLAENDHALLAEEPGLERIKVSLAALKFLFLNKIVYSTLIVCPEGSLGCTKKWEMLGTDIGWIGSLEKYCPELSFLVIEGNDDERSDRWGKNALIHLIDQETLLKDFNLNIVDKKHLSKFNCIVLDEVQNLLDKSVASTEFLASIDPGIFWTLSSFVNNDILAKLNKTLNDSCRIESKLIRRLTDPGKEYYGVKNKEFWLPPDENQKTEYKETIVNCRKELKRVLESGNPYRYQSNIFILLHKIFQVENFSHGFDSSPKTDLLLLHLKAIKSNNHKVIITSQYDRQGTKKIERLLDKADVSYVTAPSSLSADEVKKAISLFKNKKNVVAFLTNCKMSQLNFGDLKVSYLIRFDSWWNPASVWQTKDLFDCDEDGNIMHRINVFTYKMLNTIDEKIKEMLVMKGLIDDNIISVMNPNAINNLVSIDEWLKIFEMPVEEDKQDVKKLLDETTKTLADLSLADYRATLSRFFNSIGYSGVDILEHENSASFDIIGKGKSGKQEVSLYCNVLLDDVVKKKVVEQIAIDASLLQNRNTFIITRGRFEKGCDELVSDNLKLMDTKKLAHYIVTLNITHTQAAISS